MEDHGESDRHASWPGAVAAGIGVTLLALYVRQYAPVRPVVPSLTWPEIPKLVSAGRSLMALLVVNLAALGASVPLRPLWRADRRGVAAVLRTTLGLAAMAQGVLALGLLGWLSPRSLGLLTAALSLVGLWSILPAVRPFVVGGRAALALRHMEPWAWLIVPCMILPLVYAFVPTYGWDALTYHLALPERFLRLGHLEFNAYSVVTTFPLLTQLLYALALALDGPFLAKLIYLELGVLVLVALASMGGRAGRVAAVFAPLCLLSDPLFLWETTIAYSDFTIALIALLAAGAVLDWDDQPSRTLAVRAAVLAGLCPTVKYQGIIVVVALSLALLLAGRQPFRRRLRMVIALGAGVLLLLAPWLFRNLIQTGTPLGDSAFDPVFVRQMVAFRQATGMGHGFLDLLAAPWNVTMRTTPGLYAHSFGYQIGPLYLLSGLLAMAVVRRVPRSSFLLCAIGVQFVAWFLSFQESRYLLPILVLLALVGAMAVQRIVDAATPVLRVALALTPLVAFFLAQLWFWNFSGPVYRIALGDVPWETVIQATPAEEVGAILRADPRPGIRVLSLFESRTWHLRGVDSIPYHFNEGSPTLLAVHRALASRSLCRWMASERITHVVVNTTTPRTTSPFFVEGYSAEDYGRDLDLLNRFLGSSAELRRDVRGTLLFELRPPAACHDPQPDPAR